MSKTQSGYRITVTMFMPCDMNDPEDMINSGQVMKELDNTIAGAVADEITIEGVKTRFMQRVDVGSHRDPHVHPSEM